MRRQIRFQRSCLGNRRCGPKMQLDSFFKCNKLLREKLLEPETVFLKLYEVNGAPCVPKTSLQSFHCYQLRWDWHNSSKNSYRRLNSFPLNSYNHSDCLWPYDLCYFYDLDRCVRLVYSQREDFDKWRACANHGFRCQNKKSTNWFRHRNPAGKTHPSSWKNTGERKSVLQGAVI